MTIRIRDANVNNLQSIDATIGDGLTVVTGVSGSGKTSLIFDTLYHEARRRFVEIYALGSSNLRLAPALVESFTGLDPGHRLRSAPLPALALRQLRRPPLPRLRCRALPPDRGRVRRVPGFAGWAKLAMALGIAGV